MIAVRKTTSGILLLLVAVASACGARQASSVSLGGTSEPAPQVARPVQPPAEPSLSAAEEASAEEVKVVAPASPAPVEAARPAAEASAFAFRSLAVGDRWSRLIDIDFSVVAQARMQGESANVDVHVTSHQELRFEVLAVAEGKVSALSLHYVDASSKTEMMGQTVPETEVVSGKRYVVTFPNGKASVASAQGNKPSAEELDIVTDDAEEPEQNQLALKELSALAPKGKGDLSPAAALALAGGDQDDIKVTTAKATLRKLNVSTADSRGENALLDVTFGLAGDGKNDGMKMDATLNGTVLVSASPFRVRSIGVSGPVKLVASDPDGSTMDGTGKMRMDVSYRF